MSGKITFKHGLHPSRVGAFEPAIALSERALLALAAHIGRQLSPEEIERTEDVLGGVCGLRKSSDRVTAQDVRKTLEAIACAHDDAIFVAVQNCDATTHAYIVAALHKMTRRMGLKAWEFDAFEPAMLRAGALAALSNMPAGREGRPSKDGHRLYFARNFVALWRDLTGTEPTTSATPSTVSPAVQCAQCLLAASGEVIDASQVAKMLRKVIA